MVDYSERRIYPRIPVGPDYTASFRAGGQDYAGVRLANLNPAGCFALVDGGQAEAFARGTRLLGMVLHHPSLPVTPLEATVMYAMAHAGEDAGSAYAGLGIRFDPLPGDLEQALQAFLAAAMTGPR